MGLLLFLSLFSWLFQWLAGISPAPVDIKCAAFPSDALGVDIVKYINEYFEKEGTYKVVSIQQLPNRVGRVTFEEGDEASKAFFQ